ncbi:hypothetical protein [Actinoplanes flavus]|uniref:Lipoprotein n=1 Tax=Actinoplanes flavus TaxID=2820290 RepID=A0ABS3UXU2_9ACTN|nr:hypothetical protein [Actinoplanes flavus]MBO3743408.1 hypothetical protein [Actinoplanes flavus]
MRNWRINLALALSALSLLIVLGQCASDFNTGLQSEPELATASQVEAVAHVTLPPGTVLLSAVYSNGLETRLAATFRMPRAALDGFVASGRFTAQPVAGLRPVTGKDDLGGGGLWKPEESIEVAGIDEAEAPGPDGTYRNVLFGLDDPDSVLVHLTATKK